MLIIPFLQYAFIKKGLTNNGTDGNRTSFLEKLQHFYNNIIPKLFNHPKMVIGAGAFSVVLAGIIFCNITQRLMPVAERNQFVVEFYLPESSPIQRTAQVCDSMENILKKDPRTVSITSFVGTSSPRFHSSYAPHIPAKNFGQFIVNTKSNDATVEMLDEYTDKYAKYFPNAYLRFKQIDNEDADIPIEVRIADDDMMKAKILADSLVHRIKCIDGTSWVCTDLDGTVPYAAVKVDPVKSNQLGIDETSLATDLSSTLNGFDITTLWENDYAIDVKLKPQWKYKKSSVENLKDEYIPTPLGTSIPLKQFADVRPAWEYGQLVRRNGDKTISVLVDLKRNVNEDDIFPKVEEAVKSLTKQKYFNSASISYGGVKESDAQTIPQISSGLLIALLIIFIVLIFHYKKISLTVLTILAIPLSFFGAMLGLWVTHSQFSITAILGIVCLFGIVVRNSVILFDYAESLRKGRDGMSVRCAAIEAGKRRMRPIFLTSAAASMGVVPMILSGSPLWSPMGTVICFGSLFSMLLITTVLPVAYWLIYRNINKNKKK